MEDVLKDMSDTASKLARQLSQQCDVSPAVLTDRIQTLAQHGVPFREIERTLRSEYGAPVSTPTPPSPRAVLPETLAEGDVIAARTATHIVTGTITQGTGDESAGEARATFDTQAVWAVGIGPAQDLTEIFTDLPLQRMLDRSQQSGWTCPQARLETVENELAAVLPLARSTDATGRSVHWETFTPVLELIAGQIVDPTHLLNDDERPPDSDAPLHCDG